MQEWQVLIVEDNRQFAEAIQKYFSIQKDFSVCGAASNAQEAINLLHSVTPDLILLDLVMPGSDGFVLLEYLHDRAEPKPDVIVLTSLNHDSIIQKASDLGAAYYMVKPVSLEDLYARCTDIVGFRTASNVRDPGKIGNLTLCQQVETLIFNMGVPSHSRGYGYLAEAICLVHQEPELIYHITGQLYPFIAEKFNTTAGSVERAIRHVIEMAWKNDHLQNANRLIRFIAFSPQHKPTNGEFISIVVKKCMPPRVTALPV